LITGNNININNSDQVLYSSIFPFTGLNIEFKSIFNFIVNIFKSIFNFIVNIFKPVTINYPKELLAEQHYGIAITILIMCISIMMLFFSFAFNVFILLFSPSPLMGGRKIINYFNNKYIRAYLNINFRVVIIELFIISFLIFYFFYKICCALIFLITHNFIVN
jgi:hypothetical protein